MAPHGGNEAIWSPEDHAGIAKQKWSRKLWPRRKTVSTWAAMVVERVKTFVAKRVGAPGNSSPWCERDGRAGVHVSPEPHAPYANICAPVRRGS